MDLNNVKFTWLEDSPKHWGQKKVKHLFKYSKEKIENPKDYPILSLTMRGVKERDVSSNEGQLPDTFNGYSLLKKNQLVFNPMDLISGWVDSTHIEGIISPSYRIIEPLSNDIIIGYYRYYFQKLYKEKVLFPFGEGVHYQYRWGLGSVTLMNFPLLYPSKKEQQQIVSFLDDKTQKIDSLIKQKEKKIELLKEKRISLINHVVTKGLDSNMEMKDTGVEWIGEIPNHWEYGKIKFFVNYKKGYPFKSENMSDKGLPIIKVTSVKKLKINPPKTFYNGELLDKITIVKEGDIIITTVGSKYEVSNSSVGQLGLVEKEQNEFLLNQNTVSIRTIENSIVNNVFIFMCFQSKRFRNYLDIHSHGTVNQSSLNVDDILNFNISYPSHSEQQQIVEYLDKQTEEIDTLIKLEQKKIDTLKEYRQSLISEVVTGKIRVCKEDNSLSLNS